MLLGCLLLVTLVSFHAAACCLSPLFLDLIGLPTAQPIIVFLRTGR